MVAQIRIGSSDLEVTPLALGGNVFGWTADEAESFRILDAFVDAGGNHIDTADMYSSWHHGNEGGDSEAIIGRWLAQSGKRDVVTIATKVGKLPARPGLSRQNILDCAEESLRHLGVEAIDLYYAHADDPDVPLEETLGAFDELVQAGKVRYIAASNYSPARLAQALKVSDDLGLARYVALQQHYNLMHREEFEGQMLALIQSEGMTTLPYFGLAAGFLTGKYRQAADVTGARSPRVEQYMNERGMRVLAALDSVVEARGVPMASVALAWLRQQPGVAAPIASASRLDQVLALVASLDIELSSDELALLDTASR
jgi:aryl-alcohol dehydrogenase-like predicted oxidoreductase